MRLPERIEADKLRPGMRTATGGDTPAPGGGADILWDQVLDATPAVPAAKTAMRFRQSGTVRGFRNGVFRREGAF